MRLKLTRPIVFFDIETTGLTIGHDKIVEISLVKVHPDLNRETMTMRINPGIHIPEEASAVHGIYDEDVADKPTFKMVAHKVAQFIEGCDIGGYNSNKFDIPMLAEEFLTAGMTDIDLRKTNCVDVQNIFHKKEQRTLSAAYKFYCGKDLIGAHGAEADTMATADVFFAQVDRYDDLPTDIKSLAEYSAMNKNVDYAGRMVYDEKGEVVFNFGKHKGKGVKFVFLSEPNYYDWMMQGDFSQDTKRILTRLRLEMNKRLQ